MAIIYHPCLPQRPPENTEGSTTERWGDTDALQPSPTPLRHASALLLPSPPVSSDAFPKSCLHICSDTEGFLHSFSLSNVILEPHSSSLSNPLRFWLGFPAGMGFHSFLCWLRKHGLSHKNSTVSLWKDLPTVFPAWLVYHFNSNWLFLARLRRPITAAALSSTSQIRSNHGSAPAHCISLFFHAEN